MTTSRKTREYWIEHAREWAEIRLMHPDYGATPQLDEFNDVMNEMFAESLEREKALADVKTLTDELVKMHAWAAEIAIESKGLRTWAEGADARLTDCKASNKAALAMISSGNRQIGEMKNSFAYLREACMNLLEYRKRNTLNFQLEKLDDYLRDIKAVLYEPPAPEAGKEKEG